MNDAGIIEFRKSCVERVSLFTVWENGKRRLVIDARFANLRLGDIDHFSLATGAAFGELEVDAGPSIAVAGVDIAYVFYHILLPPELRG